MIATTCLAAVTACFHGKQEQKEQKPNIVIIYVDDLGFGDIGVNGAIGVKTPNNESLAKAGLNIFSKCLFLDLVWENKHVVSIAPRAVETVMNREKINFFARD